MIWREIQPPRFLTEGQPGVKAYQAEVVDGHLSVFVGQLPDGSWHLSISHRRDTKGKVRPGRLPRWDEIHDARYRFLADDLHMAMILPPKAEYVNMHPTTFHLHEVPDRQATA